MAEHTAVRKPKPMPQPAPALKPASAPPASRLSPSLGGQKLDPKTQREMSARFGHDFSQVRIHTDTQAAQSARTLGANAYAVGSDIVFGAGRYAPGSSDGDRLLAHELTHIVQQSQSGLGSEERLSGKDDASEAEAEALASQVLEGQAVQVQSTPGAVIARDGDESDNPFENPYVKWGGKALEYVPGIGLLGEAIGVAGDTVGSMTGKSTGDKVLSGAKAATGLAGMTAGLGGFELLGEAGLSGALGTMFGAGGTGLGALGTVGGLGAEVPATMEATAALGGAGLEGAAALGPGAAVVGAGLAGVGAGIGLDHLSNYVGQKITGDDKGDYSISNGLSHVMTGADNLFTGGMRAVGAYDDSKPEYAQTMGMKLANLFTPTTDSTGHEDSFTSRLGNLF